MLSWLGFGKKEKQPSTEESQNEIQSAVEAEVATVVDAVEPLAESVEQVVELTVEPVIEQTEEQETSVSVIPSPGNVAEDVSALDPIIEDASVDITEPVAVEPITEPVIEEIVSLAEPELASELAIEALPEAKLLAAMEAAEQVEPLDEVIVVDEPALEVVEQPSVDTPTVSEPKDEETDEVKAETKLGFFARLKQGLSKTRQNLGDGLIDLFRGKQIDDDLFEELETHLLLADVGVETTMKIIDSLTQSASRKQLKDASALYELLKIELKKIIADVSQPLVIPEGEGPFVILMVGVNGVGKTTTIGKLAKQFQAQGKSVILAAGDTFRAAAVEQLQVWGERNNIPVIAQHTGADSASVIFDAISAAKARKVDVIIADTAGRLQNKAHLMEELKKVVRVMKKLDVNAPHEVMLTLDAGTGQNALSQTKLFDEAVGLTGLTITKLDGTAKGGVIFAVADKHSIPIRYLGVGEGIDDLRPFNGDDFIEALFSK
ncbi:signal recognition particle-docking protein FtsY [Colwellia sp. 12G3]|uniref:signal recognition particle-docking protein FtsY n=1 Tax=Colwellia sp. 12G3 TaxID=2058299 RepID=UPI000C32E633|nr:signal recognition particle-docking protein FtsY [Colwellia sp. 12G3]PKI16518.1 signal recognition particle-docking protein FtsY [Colwellia sp. 12G3]